MNKDIIQKNVSSSMYLLQECCSMVYYLHFEEQLYEFYIF